MEHRNKGRQVDDAARKAAEQKGAEFRSAVERISRTIDGEVVFFGLMRMMGTMSPTALRQGPQGTDVLLTGQADGLRLAGHTILRHLPDDVIAKYISEEKNG